MSKLLYIKQKIFEAAQCAHRNINDIQLIAVSKGRSHAEIIEFYQQGIHDFAENRLDQALEKQELLPKDISWHFIGSLQSNKVRKAIGHFALIHSVDRLALAQKIDAISREKGVKTSILLQVNTSNEISKQGFTKQELEQQFSKMLELQHLCIKGFMTMGPKLHGHHVDQTDSVRKCFRELYEFKERLCLLYPEIRGYCRELSMGMSQDFEIAIEEGATLVRIGSALF